MSHSLGSFHASDVLRRRSRRRVNAMWVAITGSVAAVIIVLGTGRGDSAWAIAAGLLVLTCLAVCTWAGISAQHDIDAVAEEAKRFVAERQRRSSGNGPTMVEPTQRKECQ